MHFNGSFHANEWITSLTLMKFVEQLAEAVIGGKWCTSRATNMMKELYDKVSLWVVPMVNPDGVELVHFGIWPGHPYGPLLLKWNQG